MPELPETRKSLLLQMREADQLSAWTTFLAIYEPAIFQFARSRGLQDADAHDVTQQVLVAVHKKVPQWDSDQHPGSFRSWLFTVTRNLASKNLRGQAAAPFGGVAITATNFQWQAPMFGRTKSGFSFARY